MIDTTITNISFLLVFIEGLLSFFSPCVIPLLPIYLGYLSGSLNSETVNRKRSMFFTGFFILGIFTALLLLNTSFVWISSFFQDTTVWMMRIGGLLIIGLGILQLGIFQLPILQRTFRLPIQLSHRKMNPLLAFVLGFTFSFSWTPCIGPALASILILASNASSFFLSTLLVVLYAIGFALPFFVLSFFTKQASSFFHRHMTALSVLTKVGAIILIFMGILMFSGNLRAIGAATNTTDTSNDSSSQQSTQQTTQAPDFTLQDQNGNAITLSSFEGKVVYMNFWGTWCPACKSELPDFQKLYDKYKDGKDVVVLSIVLPNMGKETDVEGIKDFMKENGYTFPVLFDESGMVFQNYGIQSFPTVFMIDEEQQVYGYLSGALSLDVMEDIIAQTKEGKKE